MSNKCRAQHAAIAVDLDHVLAWDRTGLVDGGNAPALHIHIGGIEQACVARIEHAHVAKHDRIVEAMRETLGELAEEFAIGSQLPGLERVGIGFPSRLYHADVAGIDEAEEALLGVVGEPQPTRVGVQACHVEQRDLDAAALRLEPLRRGLFDAELAARQRREPAVRLARDRPHGQGCGFKRRFNGNIGRGARYGGLTLIRVRFPLDLVATAREGLVHRCTESRLSSDLVAGKRSVARQLNLFLERGTASVLRILVGDLDAPVGTDRGHLLATLLT